jgi:hypothetical protein
MRVYENDAVRDVPRAVGGRGNWKEHLHVDPEILWNLMQSRGIGVDALAVELRKTRRTVYGWLAGTCSPPIMTLKYLADFLGVAPEDLLYQKGRWIINSIRG